MQPHIINLKHLRTVCGGTKPLVGRMFKVIFMLDIKKVTKTPQTQWEAVDLLVKSEQKLLDAINIMQSIIDNRGDEYWEFHEKKIKEFLAQFEHEAVS